LRSGMKGLLLRSALTREDFEKVYFLLSGPALHGDCGELCGRMCCQEYEPGVGMYLIPGEECMFTGKEPWLKWRYQWAKNHDFPPEWDGLVQFVVCKGICPRERRPVQCRTFPLMPYLDTSGNLDARLDALTGSLICPLVRSSNKHSLRPEFVENVLEAWKILLKDPLVRADVAQQSRKLDQDEGAPWRRLLV
jgi:hypothetical protein